jgi:hypothetical protein
MPPSRREWTLSFQAGRPMEPLTFGPVRIHLGDKSGKYPDGNQVIVQGADTRVAFDTPLVANRIGPNWTTWTW